MANRKYCELFIKTEGSNSVSIPIDPTFLDDIEIEPGQNEAVERILSPISDLTIGIRDGKRNLTVYLKRAHDQWYYRQFCRVPYAKDFSLWHW